MQSRDTDLFHSPLDGMSGLVAFRSHNLEFAVRRERLVVLRDLITLRKIGIEIVFSREDGLVIDVQSKSQRGASSELNGTFVKNRKRARQTQANGTRIRVRLVAKSSGTAAKDFRFSAQLGMNLEADYCFPVSGHLVGSGFGFWFSCNFVDVSGEVIEMSHETTRTNTSYGLSQ